MLAGSRGSAGPSVDQAVAAMVVPGRYLGPDRHLQPRSRRSSNSKSGWHSPPQRRQLGASFSIAQPPLSSTASLSDSIIGPAHAPRSPLQMVANEMGKMSSMTGHSSASLRNAHRGDVAIDGAMHSGTAPNYTISRRSHETKSLSTSAVATKFPASASPSSIQISAHCDFHVQLRPTSTSATDDVAVSKAQAAGPLPRSSPGLAIAFTLPDTTSSLLEASGYGDAHAASSSDPQLSPQPHAAAGHFSAPPPSTLLSVSATAAQSLPAQPPPQARAPEAPSMSESASNPAASAPAVGTASAAALPHSVLRSPHHKDNTFPALHGSGSLDTGTEAAAASGPDPLDAPAAAAAAQQLASGPSLRTPGSVPNRTPRAGAHAHAAAATSSVASNLVSVAASGASASASVSRARPHHQRHHHGSATEPAGSSPQQPVAAHSSSASASAPGIPSVPPATLLTPASPGPSDDDATRSPPRASTPPLSHLQKHQQQQPLQQHQLSNGGGAAAMMLLLTSGSSNVTSSAAAGTGSTVEVVNNDVAAYEHRRDASIADGSNNADVVSNDNHDGGVDVDADKIGDEDEGVVAISLTRRRASLLDHGSIMRNHAHSLQSPATASAAITRASSVVSSVMLDDSTASAAASMVIPGNYASASTSLHHNQLLTLHNGESSSLPAGSLRLSGVYGDTGIPMHGKQSKPARRGVVQGLGCGIGGIEGDGDSDGDAEGEGEGTDKQATSGGGPAPSALGTGVPVLQEDSQATAAGGVSSAAGAGHADDDDGGSQATSARVHPQLAGFDPTTERASTPLAAAEGDGVPMPDDHVSETTAVSPVLLPGHDAAAAPLADLHTIVRRQLRGVHLLADTDTVPNGRVQRLEDMLPAAVAQHPSAAMKSPDGEGVEIRVPAADLNATAASTASSSSAVAELPSPVPSSPLASTSIQGPAKGPEDDDDVDDALEFTITRAPTPVPALLLVGASPLDAGIVIHDMPFNSSTFERPCTDDAGDDVGNATGSGSHSIHGLIDADEVLQLTRDLTARIESLTNSDSGSLPAEPKSSSSPLPTPAPTAAPAEAPEVPSILPFRDTAATGYLSYVDQLAEDSSRRFDEVATAADEATSAAVDADADGVAADCGSGDSGGGIDAVSRDDAVDADDAPIASASSASDAVELVPDLLAQPSEVRDEGSIAHDDNYPLAPAQDVTSAVADAGLGCVAVDEPDIAAAATTTPTPSTAAAPEAPSSTQAPSAEAAEPSEDGPGPGCSSSGDATDVCGIGEGRSINCGSRDCWRGPLLAVAHITTNSWSAAGFAHVYPADASVVEPAHQPHSHVAQSSMDDCVLLSEINHGRLLPPDHTSADDDADGDADGDDRLSFNAGDCQGTGVALAGTARHDRNGPWLVITGIEFNDVPPLSAVIGPLPSFASMDDSTVDVTVAPHDAAAAPFVATAGDGDGSRGSTTCDDNGDSKAQPDDDGSNSNGDDDDDGDDINGINSSIASPMRPLDASARIAVRRASVIAELQQTSVLVRSEAEQEAEADEGGHDCAAADDDTDTDGDDADFMIPSTVPVASTSTIDSSLAPVVDSLGPAHAIAVDSQYAPISRSSSTHGSGGSRAETDDGDDEWRNLPAPFSPASIVVEGMDSTATLVDVGVNTDAGTGSGADAGTGSAADSDADARDAREAFEGRDAESGAMTLMRADGTSRSTLNAEDASDASDGRGDDGGIRVASAADYHHNASPSSFRSLTFAVAEREEEEEGAAIVPGAEYSAAPAVQQDSRTTAAEESGHLNAIVPSRASAERAVDPLAAHLASIPSFRPLLPEQSVKASGANRVVADARAAAVDSAGNGGYAPVPSFRHPQSGEPNAVSAGAAYANVVPAPALSEDAVDAARAATDTVPVVESLESAAISQIPAQVDPPAAAIVVLRDGLVTIVAPAPSPMPPLVLFPSFRGELPLQHTAAAEAAESTPVAAEISVAALSACSSSSPAVDVDHPEPVWSAGAGGSGDHDAVAAEAAAQARAMMAASDVDANINLPLATVTDVGVTTGAATSSSECKPAAGGVSEAAGAAGDFDAVEASAVQQQPQPMLYYRAGRLDLPLPPPPPQTPTTTPSVSLGSATAQVENAVTGAGATGLDVDGALDGPQHRGPHPTDCLPALAVPARNAEADDDRDQGPHAHTSDPPEPLRPGLTLDDDGHALAIAAPAPTSAHTHVHVPVPVLRGLGLKHLPEHDHDAVLELELTRRRMESLALSTDRSTTTSGAAAAGTTAPNTAAVMVTGTGRRRSSRGESTGTSAVGAGKTAGTGDTANSSASARDVGVGVAIDGHGVSCSIGGGEEIGEDKREATLTLARGEQFGGGDAGGHKAGDGLDSEARGDVGTTLASTASVDDIGTAGTKGLGVVSLLVHADDTDGDEIWGSCADASADAAGTDTDDVEQGRSRNNAASTPLLHRHVSTGGRSLHRSPPRLTLLDVDAPHHHHHHCRHDDHEGAKDIGEEADTEAAAGSDGASVDEDLEGIEADTGAASPTRARRALTAASGKPATGTLAMVSAGAATSAAGARARHLEATPSQRQQTLMQSHVQNRRSSARARTCDACAAAAAASSGGDAHAGETGGTGTGTGAAASSSANGSVCGADAGCSHADEPTGVDDVNVGAVMAAYQLHASDDDEAPGHDHNASDAPLEDQQQHEHRRTPSPQLRNKVAPSPARSSSKRVVVPASSAASRSPAGHGRIAFGRSLQGHSTSTTSASPASHSGFAVGSGSEHSLTRTHVHSSSGSGGATSTNALHPLSRSPVRHRFGEGAHAGRLPHPPGVTPSLSATSPSRSPAAVASNKIHQGHGSSGGSVAASSGSSSSAAVAGSLRRLSVHAAAVHDVDDDGNDNSGRRASPTREAPFQEPTPFHASLRFGPSPSSPSRLVSAGAAPAPASPKSAHSVRQRTLTESSLLFGSPLVSPIASPALGAMAAPDDVGLGDLTPPRHRSDHHHHQHPHHQLLFQPHHQHLLHQHQRVLDFSSPGFYTRGGSLNHLHTTPPSHGHQLHHRDHELHRQKHNTAGASGPTEGDGGSATGSDSAHPSTAAGPHDQPSLMMTIVDGGVRYQPLPLQHLQPVQNPAL